MIGEAFRTIDHIVTGKGIQRQGRQRARLHFQRQIAAGGGGIACCVAGGHGQRIGAVAQPGINRGGQIQRPVTVDVCGGAQAGAVEAGHNQRIGFTAAGQRQRLLTLSGVNNAIGGSNEVQYRWQGIHHQAAVSLAAIACHITDHHGVRCGALWQRRERRWQNRDLPVTRCVDRAAVVSAAQRDDNRLAIARHAGVSGDHAAADGIVAVKNTVIKSHARGGHRQCAGHHRQGSVAGGKLLSAAVAGRGGNRLRAIGCAVKGASR